MGQQRLAGMSDDINSYRYVLSKLLLFYWGSDSGQVVSDEVRSSEDSDLIIIYDS